MRKLEERDRDAFGVNEVASRLGISPRSVYNLLEDGSLRAVKIAGRRLILRADLLAFLEKAH
jgi:excisionase family DNA binding protein